MRILLLAMTLAVFSVTAQAQSSSSQRAGHWEWSVSGIFQESKSAGGDGGSSLEIDSATGIGFNFAYNFTSKLALGADLEFIRPRYTAVLVDESGIEDDVVIRHTASQFSGRLKGTFNVIDGPFTPFLEAGLGWSYFDSNVADGPPIVGCWWHPWLGYICEGYYSTYSDTLFSYGVGAGLRYEFRNGSFIKASYNIWELDGLGAGVDSRFGAGRIEFGWMF